MSDVPPLFTIICVFNKPDVLDRFLMPSIRSQSASYELKLVDNSTSRYTSAAAALNAGAKDARGRYLMFVHQDVAWNRPDFLASAADMLDKLPALGVAGPVGASTTAGPRRNHGRGNALAGEFPGIPVDVLAITKPEVVQTLDELMLIVPSDVFRSIGFDDVTCDSWHLYGVDFALSARRMGLNAFVVPLQILHLSGGNADDNYFQILSRIARKHGRHTRWIFSTCGTWATFLPASLQKWWVRSKTAVRLTIWTILVRCGLWPDRRNLPIARPGDNGNGS